MYTNHIGYPEMLFLETLPDYYHTTIILDMECYLNNANIEANQYSYIFYGFCVGKHFSSDVKGNLSLNPNLSSLVANLSSLVANLFSSVGHRAKLRLAIE